MRGVALVVVLDAGARDMILDLMCFSSQPSSTARCCWFLNMFVSATHARAIEYKKNGNDGYQ